MAEVRQRLAERFRDPATVPVNDETVGAFVTDASSLSYEYSWPRLD
jgi:hypothetical protein